MAYSEESAAKFDAPVYLGGMFAGDDSSSDDEAASNGMVSRKENRLDASAGRQVDAAGMRFEITNQAFPNMTMRIRQFDDHHRNANICWPEARCLAQWLVGEHLFNDEAAAAAAAPGVDAAASSAASATVAVATAVPTPAFSANDRRRERFDRMLIGFPSGLSFPASPVAAAPAPPIPAPVCSSCGSVRRPKRVLELGAATGALSIFLSSLGVDMHTSDIADSAVRDNIAFNYSLNGLSPVVHLSHSWGEALHELDAYVGTHGAPDVILGSDILAYEDDFEKLADTICRLMPPERTEEETEDDVSSDAAAPAAAASAASSPQQSRCSECHPPAVLYMCWKRSHDKSLLDGGFWRLLSGRGFRIETRGNKTYEIRRRTKQEAATEHTSLPEGQFVHFVGAAANATAGKPPRKQKMKQAEKQPQNTAK